MRLELNHVFPFISSTDCSRDVSFEFMSIYAFYRGELADTVHSLKVPCRPLSKLKMVAQGKRGSVTGSVLAVNALSPARLPLVV